MDSPYTKLAKLEEMLAKYNWAAKEVVPLFAALLSLPLPAGVRLSPLVFGFCMGASCDSWGLLSGQLF